MRKNYYQSLSPEKREAYKVRQRGYTKTMPSEVRHRKVIRDRDTRSGMPEDRRHEVLQLKSTRYHRNDGYRAGARPITERTYTLKKKYGLTLEDYYALLHRQGGKCGICGTEDSGKKSFHVDHCHKTGVVRGLLCFNCNTGIGKLGDCPDVISKAAEYVRRYAHACC